MVLNGQKYRTLILNAVKLKAPVKSLNLAFEYSTLSHFHEYCSYLVVHQLYTQTPCFAYLRCSIHVVVALTCSFVCVLEGSNKLWDIIIIIIVSISIGLTVKTGSKLLLQPLVLLGTNLLEDVGHHVLEALSFRGAGNNQQILSNGERCYKRKRMSQFAQIDHKGLDLHSLVEKFTYFVAF